MKSETVIQLKEDMERNFLDMNLVNFGGYNSKTTDNKSKKQKNYQSHNKGNSLQEKAKGQGGYSPWHHKELDTTEWLNNSNLCYGFPGGVCGKEPTCQCRRHERHGEGSRGELEHWD